MNIPHHHRPALGKRRRPHRIAGKEPLHLSRIRHAVDPHIDQRRSRLHHLRGHKSRPPDRRHQNIRLARKLRQIVASCCGTPSPSPKHSAASSPPACPQCPTAPPPQHSVPPIGSSLRRRISIIPAGVQGRQPRLSALQPPHIHRMKSIHILIRRHRLQQPLRIHMLRQRQLDQNPVDVLARIQLRPPAPASPRSSSLSGGVSISL